MSAAAKALDALEAARRKVSLPWNVNGLPLIDAGDSWAFRGPWHTPGPDASEKDKCDTVEDAEAEGVYVVAAVNLSSPLAAVARAAMARRDAISALRGGVFNESNYRDLQTAKSRVEYCDAKLDAAINDLEESAKGFA